jgi:hypothetical protein
MKYALYWIEGKNVVQWQDHALFAYNDTPEGYGRLELPLDFVFPETPHWVVNGGLTDVEPVYVPPPPPPITEAQARASRDARLTAALVRVLPLQCAAALDEATPAELVALAEWQEYCMLLGRVPEQAGFPTAINWPEIPS